MINIKYFLNRIKDVKPKDILAVFPMTGAVLVSPMFKKKYAHTWLITEEKAEARDNGYWFFRKMRENHPDQKCIYAIDKKSVDYKKVKNLGTVIQYGSFLHWIIYFCCEYNISSQKGGKPNAALCAFIELNNWYNAHNIFLQHGITKDNADWLHADKCRFEMFITGARPEKQYIDKMFGYPKGVIQLTGFPRFDNLHNFKVKKNRIVVMPTWRYWFNLKSKENGTLNSDFMHSHYLRCWKKFLENPKFNRLIEEYGLEVIFYPHRNMQYHLKDIREAVKTRAIIASWKDYDVQNLLMTSNMMVTDYSSVFFDMVYMKKPILFYQFDYDEYRKGQYAEGYFHYNDNPFGKTYSEVAPLIDEFERIIESDFQCSEEYIKAHDDYFPYYDSDNSERIYQKIVALNNGNE